MWLSHLDERSAVVSDWSDQRVFVAWNDERSVIRVRLHNFKYFPVWLFGRTVGLASVNLALPLTITTSCKTVSSMWPYYALLCTEAVRLFDFLRRTKISKTNKINPKIAHVACNQRNSLKIKEIKFKCSRPSISLLQGLAYYINYLARLTCMPGELYILPMFFFFIFSFFIFNGRPMSKEIAGTTERIFTKFP